MEKINLKHIWIARTLIGMVFIFNIQCALVFILFTDQFLSSFELEGIPGRVIIQGMGILFIMWNVPYGIAIIHPQKFVISLYSAVLMQFIGLLGESILLLTIPVVHKLLISTATRFIYFDGFGLAALVLASLITRDSLRKNPSIS